MNNHQRKQIDLIVSSLSPLEDADNVTTHSVDALRALLEEAEGLVGVLLEEEQEKFDNMPEGLQSSRKGDTIQEAIDNLESAQTSIQEALGELDAEVKEITGDIAETVAAAVTDAIGYLEDAKG